MKRHSIPQSGQSSASGVLGPQREREGENEGDKKKEKAGRVCVNACAAQSEKKIRETMRGTVAASGRDGWGAQAQHNRPLINAEHRHRAAARTY